MKKTMIGLVFLLVLAMAVPAYGAAANPEVDDLWNQITQLRKQIVDKYIDAGQMTKEQGDAIKKNIDQAEKFRQENPNSNNPGYACGGSADGGGYGMMNGNSYGMMGGYGNGYGGLMGGNSSGMMGYSI